ncbi:PIN domain-containing protein [Stenotrophomonas maltophilia]|uniref:PIN domain-containing protein n=1 Tax=Stenotrophomonas maltophilia TaxID=40324 RepID=UPI001F52CA47|nr:PIN domain-containing protein [Stenotrophomonas maltophilia]
MDDEIRDQIVTAKISALTLDTSVFERNGLAMESGLLAQMEQFNESNIELLIANTVANEVKRHLAKHATDTTKALRNALAQSIKHRVLSSSDQDELTALITRISTKDDERARRRFDDWCSVVGAQVIQERDFASISEIMRSYEAGEPPFAETGEKKQEFPDAVALSTLEGWANKHDTKILAVSQDKDWHRYGANSQRLVVIDDLAEALSTILSLAEATDPAVQLSKLFISGDSLGLHGAVLKAVQHQADKIYFRVEADSQFSVDEEWIDVTVEDVALNSPEADGSSFSAISHQGDEAVVMITGTASININVHFSFEKFDSVDRDYVGMGSAEIPEDVEVEFEALVSLRTEAGELELNDIELLPTTHNVFFSDIEPDWMSDPSSYDHD